MNQAPESGSSPESMDTSSLRAVANRINSLSDMDLLRRLRKEGLTFNPQMGLRNMADLLTALATGEVDSQRFNPETTESVMALMTDASLLDALELDGGEGEGIQMALAKYLAEITGISLDSPFGDSDIEPDDVVYQGGHYPILDQKGRTLH